MPDAKQAPGASHVAHSLTRSSILRPIQPTALSGLSRSQPLRFPEPSAESLTTRQKTPHCPDARVSPSTSALAQRALQQLQAKGILAKDSDRTFDFGKTYRHSAADNTSERDRFCYPNRQQKRVLPLPSELNQSKLSSSVLEKEQPSSRILPGLSPRHSRVIRSCQAIEKAISRPQDPSATLQPDASNGRAFLKEVRGASEAVRNITASCLGSSATHSQVPVLPPLPHRRSSSARIQQSRPIDSTKTYLTDSLPSILEKSHSRVSQLSSKMRQPTKSTQHAPGSGTSAELDRTRRPIMPYVHPATSSSSNMASPETRPIPVRRTPAAIRKSSAEEHGYDAASRVRAYENARAAKAAQDAVTASTPITPQNPATPVYARYPQPQYPIGSHTAQAAPIPGYMVYGAQTPSYRLGQNPAHTTVQNPAQNLVPQQNSGPAGHAQPAAQILPGESQWDKEAREAETRNLAVAMENSLREDQGRKANEVPLRDQSLDYILREFPDSVIMRLNPACQELMVHKGDARTKMIGMLEFEKQSCKWYPGPGTVAFFETTVHSCMTPSRAVRKTSRGGKSAAKAARGTTQSLIDFMNNLAPKIKAAQDAVYSMPSTEIPPIFAASVDQEEESDSDVEIVGEVSAAKKRKVCTIEL